MVEFRSRLDSSKTQALNKNMFKRFWAIFAILSLVFIVLGVIRIVLREDDADLIGGVVIIALGVLFTPVTYAVSQKLQKRMDKSTMFISPDTEEVYTFDEEYITITQNKGDDFTGYTKAKYSYIFKAIEEKDYYFLYISQAQCHVIDKASLTQGTEGEMNALLSNKLGSKFKRK